MGLRSVSRGHSSTGDALAPAVTARLGRKQPGGPSASVYAHDPCHVAATVPWCLIGSYGHSAPAARLEDMEAEDTIVTDLFHFDC